MSTQYTPYYFIKKLSAIPEDQWGRGFLEDSMGRRCVLGHCCGARDIQAPFGFHEEHTPESRAMIQLFIEANLPDATEVNDTKTDRFNQSTPKQRILAALRFIKEKGS